MQPHILRFLALQLLVVSPSQNTCTRAVQTKNKFFSVVSPAVNPKAKESPAQPITTEPITQANDKRISKPSGNMDVNSTEQRFISKNYEFSNDDKKHISKNYEFSNDDKKPDGKTGKIPNSFYDFQNSDVNLTQILRFAARREVGLPDITNTTRFVQKDDGFSTTSEQLLAEDTNLTGAANNVFFHINRSNLPSSNDIPKSARFLHLKSSIRSSSKIIGSNPQDNNTASGSNSVSDGMDLQSMYKKSTTVPTISAGTANMEISKSVKTQTITESVQFMSSSEAFMSCVRRCGEDTNLPCSCHEKCLVHKNCCEDLAGVCPGLYNYAARKFRHLLSAQVRCDQVAAIFVVDSCPAMSSRDAALEKTRLVDNSMSGSAPEQGQMKDGQLDRYSLSEILSNAPLTDYNTGIIYANASIFNCNNNVLFLSSNLTTNPTASTWKTQIGTAAHNIMNTGNIFDINQELDLSEYSYVPPKAHPLSAGSLCYSSEALACVSELSRRLGVQSLVCNMSVSHYYMVRHAVYALSSYEVRAHNICAWCLSSTQISLVSGSRFFSSGLQILMSVSDTPGHVVFVLPESDQRQRLSIPWLSWTCRNPDSTRNHTDRSCRVLKCSRHFVYTSEGVCRKIVDVEISLQNTFLFEGKPCRIESDDFAEFSECYFQEMFNLKPTGTPYKSFHVQEKSLNFNLTVIRMEMYIAGDDFQDNVIDELTDNKKPMSQGVLLFANQYCSTNEEQIRSKNGLAKVKSPLTVKQNEFGTRGLHVSWTGRLYPYIRRDVKAMNVSSNIFFSYCFQLFHEGSNADKAGFLSDTLNCIEYSETLLDLTNGTEIISTVSEIAAQKCLRKVEAKFKSKGCKSCFYFTMLHLIVVVGMLAGENY
ncbi:carbohydrate sulfotransferase [Elysia marginata]|uniref:Carbohydrate sulfotransferase n=1 Tax=Elysia marginata TaxID=1093978 RepID=A0AAV4HA13_9GAST|nr:carbohydrate sulfotransferase [Elysia marginata]